MKKYIWLCLLAIGMISCDRLTINQIEGTYSYKTSGILTVTDNDNKKTYDINVDNIMGTLDIQRLPQGDSVLLAFNEFNGDVVTVRARVKGDSILMPMYQKVFSLTSEAGSSWFLVNRTTTSDYIVSIIGDGFIMNNMIVFNQRILAGKIMDSDKSQSVKSNNVQTVAKKN